MVRIYDAVLKFETRDAAKCDTIPWTRSSSTVDNLHHIIADFFGLQ